MKKETMQQQNRKTPAKKSPLKQWLPAIIVAGIAGGLLILRPHAAKVFGSTAASYTLEMASILPAVLILMGIMTVMVSNEFISRYLGKAAGVKGMALALLLGTLPTGPLYIAFPFAGALKHKGASTGNLVIFLSAWACIKIPQELVELRFLGAEFMLLRLGLTIFAVAAMGLIINRTAGEKIQQYGDKT
jgi:uncharacterized membrane protein YraQ (UPF0718 family)